MTFIAFAFIQAFSIFSTGHGFSRIDTDVIFFFKIQIIGVYLCPTIIL